MIRGGKLTDLDQIVDLVERAKQKMKQEGNDQWDDTYPTKEHYEADLHNGQLYVFEQGGKIHGAACISDEGHHEYDEIPWKISKKPYLCMKRLAVDPDSRHKGIGLAFYQYADELAKQIGVPSLRTDTNGSNKAALRLFEKAGYSYVASEPHGYYKEPFVYYEKNVD
ncbi:GNAT family N-acetyltransferase [Aquisalibacillus elongatus]|uniref:Acetyltransferase (GNAT) family protein n=1 Tax=Aquisalibacillus elongatus TaxID=485577 RepID=A0A3N5BH06_9BACI|nr:GNAT family N-acetyltransferase [Aquisalibacillus elongatus]RPF57074.1 acetyltransferase (GNAT) family protein [Aquisalibacillus elongatus]